MKILVLHNAYQHRGGEDSVVEAEAALLRSAGHSVHVERVTNDSIVGLSASTKAFLNTPFNQARIPWVEQLVREFGAEVVHVHNFFPLLSPAVYLGARNAGAAVVQTLHNYRIKCANGLFLRDGKICEKCLTGSRVWSIYHRCYRNSLAGSIAVARMQAKAESDDTWSSRVDNFIALTEFAREKFIEGGLPPERILVKPNFVKVETSASSERVGALFVGRLSIEKGVETLLRAWTEIPQLKLTVVGDGPERSRLESIAPPNVEFVGSLPPNCVREAMAKARFLVVPSIWYEGFPMTVVEAFASRLPVVASEIGSLSEIVTGDAGLTFQPGNHDDLVRAVEKLLTLDISKLGEGAYQKYLQLYTPASNLTQLIRIYQSAIENMKSA